MFEQWPSNQSQDCTESIIDENVAIRVPRLNADYICCSHSGNDSEQLPFIVHTSEVNTRNFARSLGASQQTSLIDKDGNASERPMSPTHARLRRAEKQRHHRADIGGKEDDIHVQEAIFNSLQNGSSSKKQESEVSDDIAAIVDRYLSQEPLMNVEQPIVIETG